MEYIFPINISTLVNGFEHQLETIEKLLARTFSYKNLTNK